MHRWLRPQIVLLGLCAVSVALRLVTYDRWADGDLVLYALAAAVPVVGAFAAWGLARVQTTPRALLPWFAALLVLVPGDVTHYLRRLHPSTLAGQLEVVLTDEFSGPAGAAGTGRQADAARSPMPAAPVGLAPLTTPSSPAGAAPAPDRWIVEVKPGASVSVQDGELRIENAPRAVGFVGLVLPDRSQTSGRQRWQPVGPYRDAAAEWVEWGGAVRRDGAFYVMLDVRRLLLQATAYGLHITYPGRDQKLTEYHVEFPEVNDGRAHQFRLERNGELARLYVDGGAVWVQPDAGPWEFVRFGETRSDELHGGTLRLTRVQYGRRYER